MKLSEVLLSFALIFGTSAGECIAAVSIFQQKAVDAYPAFSDVVSANCSYNTTDPKKVSRVEAVMRTLESKRNAIAKRVGDLELFIVDPDQNYRLFQSLRIGDAATAVDQVQNEMESQLSISNSLRFEDYVERHAADVRRARGQPLQTEPDRRSKLQSQIAGSDAQIMALGRVRSQKERALASVKNEGKPSDVQLKIYVEQARQELAKLRPVLGKYEVLAQRSGQCYAAMSGLNNEEKSGKGQAGDAKNSVAIQVFNQGAAEYAQ